MKGAQLQRTLDGVPLEPTALREHILENNKNTACIVNIESVAAMDNLDEILAVPGVDAVLIGPHDLSISIGHPCEWAHPEFHAAIETIITKARAAGKGAGIHYAFDNALEYQEKWMKQGANIVLHSSDIYLYQQTLTRDLTRLKKAAGVEVAAPAGESAPIV